MRGYRFEQRQEWLPYIVIATSEESAGRLWSLAISRRRRWQTRHNFADAGDSIMIPGPRASPRAILRCYTCTPPRSTPLVQLRWSHDIVIIRRPCFFGSTHGPVSERYLNCCSPSNTKIVESRLGCPSIYVWTERILRRRLTTAREYRHHRKR